MAIVVAEASEGPIRFDFEKSEAVRARLSRYKGNDVRREATLHAMFEEAGCTAAHLTEQRVPGRKAPNVICVLPGSTSDTVIVGAHFDYVDEGDGVIDNWSGASLLPSLYQSMSAVPRRLTFVFTGFSGEEKGELGSKEYVRQLTPDAVAKTRLMVNIDSLGASTSAVWATRSEPEAVKLLAATAKSLQLPLVAGNIDGLGESDEEAFIVRDICTIVVHSMTPATMRMLHSPNDNLSAIQFDDYYNSYKLLAAYLAVLDERLPTEHARCSLKPLVY